jgi:hypothetical protein
MSLQNLDSLSRLTGSAPRTIKRRLAQLTPTKQGRQLMWESRDALPLILCPTRGTEDSLDPPTERAALDKARRLEIEQKLAEREKRLIPAELVADHWVRHITIARNRFLGLPSRLAPSLLRCKDLRALELALKTAIHEVLTELAGADATPE